MHDVFTTQDGRPRRVRGVAVYSSSPRLAELAVRIGFETVWIEMEHGPADFGLVEAMCQAVEAGGGLPTVRISDRQRCHVLRALEVGARIVVVPMVDTAEHAREIVAHGKFPPLGSRGFNTRSRGLGYGLSTPLTAFAEANARTHLIAQVETRAAVANIDSICAVEGLSGILIGPGDLSMQLGCPADFSNPALIETAAACIRRARGAGRHAGILAPPGKLLDACLEAGCDLFFCGGDVAYLSSAWKAVLERFGGP